MGRYHAILFDMDGTLLDTLTDMQDAVNHVLAAHGLPLRTLEEVRCFVGNGAGPLIHRALPEGYPQEQKVLAEYRAYYQAHNCIRTCPYPGIPELLEQLRQRGLKLDGPAHLALQEDTVPVGVAVAVLPAGPLIRHQLVDQPLLLQPLQLAVYGGQSHGLPAAAEPVRQHHGRGAAAGAGGDAVQPAGTSTAPR